MANNTTSVSDFYCTQCGSKGLPIVRTTHKMREPGHLKKLYCPQCRIQTNHCEVRPFGKYDYEDFQIEFIHGNFDSEGQRIDPSWRHFVAEVLNKENQKNENQT